MEGGVLVLLITPFLSTSMFCFYSFPFWFLLFTNECCLVEITPSARNGCLLCGLNQAALKGGIYLIMDWEVPLLCHFLWLIKKFRWTHINGAGHEGTSVNGMFHDFIDIFRGILYIIELCDSSREVLHGFGGVASFQSFVWPMESWKEKGKRFPFTQIKIPTYVFLPILSMCEYRSVNTHTKKTHKPSAW